MTAPYVTANLIMRVLGDNLPFPYIIYELNITEGQCEEKLKLNAYKTARYSQREDILDNRTDKWKPMGQLYHSLKDTLPLYLSMSDQPLLQPFSPTAIELGKENRVLHPLDELCLLQSIIHELHYRDPAFFEKNAWPAIQNLGGKPTDPRVYNFLRLAYKELTPAGNIYKPTSQNPTHGQKEKGGRDAHKRRRKRPA